MNSFSRLFFSVIAFVCATPTALAYEQPNMKVLESAANGIEIREVASMIVAEVETVGERDAAIRDGFRLLAGYIFGGNTSKTKVAMTAPVTQAESQKIAMTVPVTQTELSPATEENKRWRVTFMMPSEFTLETLPKPNDARVRFATEPARKTVSIRFSGFATQNNLKTHRDQLEAFVASRQLKTVGPYTSAFYDDPLTLPWNRRNEWIVEVQ